MNFGIVKNRKIWLGISVILTVISLGLLISLGFKAGIDFTGGSLWQVKYESEVEEGQIREALLSSGMEGVSVNKGSDGSYWIRFIEVNEERHQELVIDLRKKTDNFEELSFQSIGPSIGQELKQSAIWAVVLVLLGISLFVAYAFRKVSEPVSSWAYGGITLMTLFHDVIIPSAVVAVLGRVIGLELDTNLVVALLVIAGFSVHDTIVVFDRIRENLSLVRGKIDLKVVVEKSIKETIARSINTSVTLVFVLVALLFIGPPTLYYFILIVLIGTILGTYSSIFLASPMLVAWEEYKKLK